MNIILSIFLFSALSIAGINSTPQQSNEARDISFYKVPLVCNAAPSIGCGSRSKPVLNGLEDVDGVKEAWLNRQGDVIAIVWNENAVQEESRQAVINAFTKYEVNANELLMDEYVASLASFSANNEWYRAEDVNALSMEEAEIIADQLMALIIDKADFDKTDQQAFQKDIQKVFYDFFLNYEDLEQLADANVYKNKLQTIVTLGEQYVGEGNMPTVDELWEVCSGDSGSCDQDCCKDSCKITSTKE